MKFIFPLLLLQTSILFSQSIPNYDDIRLKTNEDYKAAEPTALKAASFLLSNTFDPNDENRLKSIQFILKWMEGTPDYSFSLDGLAAKITKDSPDMLGLYMACMVKYCLENPASAKDQQAVKLNSVKILLTYCDKADNNIKMTKQLKKLSEANKKGELEKAL